jgi:hypothetical protein
MPVASQSAEGNRFATPMIPIEIGGVSDPMDCMSLVIELGSSP